MPVTSLSPRPETIRDHIEHITRRFGELDVPCVFELRFLTAEKKARCVNVARFAPDVIGIGMACDHAAAMNKKKLNGYIVVNPIRADAQIKTGNGAEDSDIAASFFHWADADDKQAADNIKNFVGPRPTFFVLTGTQPCARPHVYWELEEPTQNLEAWESTQRAIAATLQTDRSVVNPSRIMRLAGTINWPKPQKREKGYKQELTTLRIYQATGHV